MSASIEPHKDCADPYCVRCNPNRSAYDFRCGFCNMPIEAHAPSCPHRDPLDDLKAIGETLPDPPQLKLNETLHRELTRLYISDMHKLVFRLAARVRKADARAEQLRQANGNFCLLLARALEPTTRADDSARQAEALK